MDDHSSRWMNNSFYDNTKTAEITEGDIRSINFDNNAINEECEDIDVMSVEQQGHVQMTI